MIRKILGGLTALVLTSAGVIGAASVAEAHTPSVSSTCEALTVSLTNYQGGTAASPATTKTDYQRYSWTGGPEGPTTGAPGDGWNPDEKSKPHDDPIGSIFQKGGGNSSWFFWTATEVEDQPAVAAQTNEVSVIIDGATIVDHQSFGGSYSNSFNLGDKYVAHTYKVIVRAYDDPTGSKGWSKNFNGTSTPCERPAPPTKPEVKTTFSAWTDGTWVCGDTTVTQTRTKTVIDSTLVDNVWIDSAPVVTTETQTRPLTGDEAYPCPTEYTPTCTQATGSETIYGDGVISVEGDWDESTIAVPFSGTLADIGTVLDIQATPIQYVGLHIHTAEGDIVFEEEGSYSGKLWSQSTWDDGVAPYGQDPSSYKAFGSIEEYIHLNGDVVVTGIDLLYTNPEAASTTVKSFTIGCTTYTFVPVPPEPEYTTPVFTPVDACGVENDEFYLGTAPEGSTDYGTEGIEYSYDGDSIATATPLDGYEITLPEDSPWTLNEDGTATLDVTPFFTDEPCETTPPPTTEPPVTTPPTETPVATPSPSASATPVAATSSTHLASTGSDVLPWAAGGAIAIMAGIALFAGVRNRRTNQV